MDPLSQLHDIQLPDPIIWWPPAVGWYLVMLVILLFIFILWKIKSRPTRKDIRREALSLLNDADYAGVSTLLRRVAVYQYPRKEVAGLQGEAWLAFLDKTGKTTDFSKGAGRILVTAPYQAKPAAVDDDLVRLVTEWINLQELR